MGQYQVLARKYRPQKFADVVAQGTIVATLKNAVRMERTAHAYLFCGSRGTGKTTLARLFAKVLNCLSPSEEIEPCNQCASCRSIASGHAIDVLEIDGASHRGIEDIRQINETVAFAPSGGRYKIYLIDEVHMLTKEAFNALLKTLEEPPAHVKFFFCTTEPHKIPATILSRCQRFNLMRIPIDKLAARLTHIADECHLAIEPQVMVTLAERAEGSLRDALSLLDQLISFQKGKITVSSAQELLGLPSQELFFQLDHAGAKHDLMAAFKIAQEVFTSGMNLHYFLEELISHFRLLLLMKQGCLGIPEESLYTASLSYYRSEQLIQILEFLIEGQHNLKSAPSEKTAIEMLLLKILRTHQELSLETLVHRLITLENRLSTTENPTPKPEELPDNPKQLPPPPVIEQKESAILTVKEQSRFETIMRFAAKELNGSLKKPEF